MTATDLVIPADNMAALDTLDAQAREVAVTNMLAEARQWLAHAVEATEPARVSMFKEWAATVAETTKRLRLSREIQLDATEMVRRAERGVGSAVRVGQAAGSIRTQADTRSPGTNNRVHDEESVSPRQFFPEGNQTMTDTYAMTDNVTDEQFDKALDEAKAEGNLSRANVVRKIRGDEAPKGDRPEVLHRTRRLDSNRIVSGIVEGAVVPTSVLEHVDYAALDRDQLGEWTDSLAESIRALTALKKRLAAEHEKEPIQ